MPAQPFEVISTEDKEQFSTQHGSTLQAYDLTAKNPSGEPVLIKVNRKPTNPPPSPGETIWLETWETEFGLKGKKAQGPRQASLAPGGDSRDRSIVRQHSQHMALQFAALQGGLPPDPGTALKTIEAWTDHFDADVDRAAGSPPQAPPTQPQSTTSTHPNGGKPDTISKAQMDWALKLKAQHNISDENWKLLGEKFGIAHLNDLPKTRFDEFRAAMVEPIPDGSSDVPGDFQPTPSDDDSQIPF